MSSENKGCHWLKFVSDQVWRFIGIFTLPETNSSPLKIDHLKRRFLLEMLVFRGVIGYPKASKITMNWKNLHFLQTIMLGTHVEFPFVDETRWFLPRCRSMRHQPRLCRKWWKAGRNWGLFFLWSSVGWEGGEKQGTVATNILYCTRGHWITCIGGIEPYKPTVILNDLQLMMQCLYKTVVLMEETLHQLRPQISHYLQGFNHLRWCRISSINSRSKWF